MDRIQIVIFIHIQIVSRKLTKPAFARTELCENWLDW